MAQLKAGTRLRSAVCKTEVMVVMAPDADVALECGGTPMLTVDAEPPTGGAPAPEHSAGTAIGKRYVDEAGSLEILCTKPGEGSLSAGGKALTVKGAKPLPSSD
jgi:hypothetical protein